MTWMVLPDRNRDWPQTGHRHPGRLSTRDSGRNRDRGRDNAAGCGRRRRSHVGHESQAEFCGTQAQPGRPGRDSVRVTVALRVTGPSVTVPGSTEKVAQYYVTLSVSATD